MLRAFQFRIYIALKVILKPINQPVCQSIKHLTAKACYNSLSFASLCCKETILQFYKFPLITDKIKIKSLCGPVKLNQNIF